MRSDAAREGSVQGMCRLCIVRGDILGITAQLYCRRDVAPSHRPDAIERPPLAADAKDAAPPPRPCSRPFRRPGWEGRSHGVDAESRNETKRFSIALCMESKIQHGKNFCRRISKPSAPRWRAVLTGWPNGSAVAIPSLSLSAPRARDRSQAAWRRTGVDRPQDVG